VIQADGVFSEYSYEDGVMAVLPGGMPGTNHLMAHEGLKNVLLSYNKEKKYLAAICAAPSVLGMNGLLEGRHATCYPGFEEKLNGATCLENPVVVDRNIITSRGMGTAILFALEIVRYFADDETVENIKTGLVYA